MLLGDFVHLRMLPFGSQDLPRCMHQVLSRLYDFVEYEADILKTEDLLTFWDILGSTDTSGRPLI